MTTYWPYLFVVFLSFLSEGLKGLWDMCGEELHCKLGDIVQNETQEHTSRMKSVHRFCGDLKYNLKYNIFVLNQSYGFPCCLDAWDTTDCHHMKNSLLHQHRTTVSFEYNQFNLIHSALLILLYY